MKRRAPKRIQVGMANVSGLLEPYSSGWVALSPDRRRVVAAAATLQEAQSEAQKQGQPHPVFVKVLPPDKGYVPAHQ